METIDRNENRCPCTTSSIEGGENALLCCGKRHSRHRVVAVVLRSGCSMLDVCSYGCHVPRKTRLVYTYKLSPWPCCIHEGPDAMLQSLLSLRSLYSRPFFSWRAQQIGRGGGGVTRLSRGAVWRRVEGAFCRPTCKRCTLWPCHPLRGCLLSLHLPLEGQR